MIRRHKSPLVVNGRAILVSSPPREVEVEKPVSPTLVEVSKEVVDLDSQEEVVLEEDPKQIEIIETSKDPEIHLEPEPPSEPIQKLPINKKTPIKKGKPKK